MNNLQLKDANTGVKVEGVSDSALNLLEQSLTAHGSNSAGIPVLADISKNAEQILRQHNIPEAVTRSIVEVLNIYLTNEQRKDAERIISILPTAVNYRIRNASDDRVYNIGLAAAAVCLAHYDPILLKSISNRAQEIFGEERTSQPELEERIKIFWVNEDHGVERKGRDILFPSLRKLLSDFSEDPFSINMPSKELLIGMLAIPLWIIVDDKKETFLDRISRLFSLEQDCPHYGQLSPDGVDRDDVRFLNSIVDSKNGNGSET